MLPPRRYSNDLPPAVPAQSSTRLSTPASPRTEAAAAAVAAATTTTAAVTVQALTAQQESEALAFLAARPLHTVIMAGYIRDNGVTSALNRGVFYACRNASGALEGVALIGHATLIEARTEAALEAFARLAREASPSAHLIMGEEGKIAHFWSYYAEAGRTPRRACRELLFEQRWPSQLREEATGLRQATLDELSYVMPVQAQMALAESGVNPLEADPVGFRMRCARRIEQGRVWVWIESGRLLFKADIMAETPAVIYLEGIWVNPREQGRGYGQRCLSHLGRRLLMRTGALTLLVNEQHREAIALYTKVGFKLSSAYDTIFLQS